jgi:hypothetical protein
MARRDEGSEGNPLMTELDVKLLDLAFKALEPKPLPVRYVRNPLNYCDVCGTEDKYASFIHDYQSGREISLCDNCAR